jgi:acyl dehydratase
MIEVDLTTLRGRIGQEIALSDWIEVTQARINQFAEATGDRQWIHVNPARAATDSPYKTTIAHGFLTLSLVSALLENALRLSSVRMAINYGVNRVRFISAVPSGTRIRGRFRLIALDEAPDSIQAAWDVTVEREGSEKPCSVVEWLIRYYM